MAATPRSAVRSAAVEVAGAGERARRVDPDGVGEVGPQHALDRDPGALRHRLALGEPAEPDRRHQPRVLHLDDGDVVRVGHQLRGLGEQRVAACRVTGRRLRPGEADQHLGPQRRVRVPGKQLLGPAVGGEGLRRVARDGPEEQPAAAPRRGLLGRCEPAQRGRPLPLEVLGPSGPGVHLGELQASRGVVRVAAQRLGPERGGLRQRAQRAGVPRGSLPAGRRQVVPTRLLEVPRDLGGAGVTVLRCCLDRVCDGQVGALRVAQVGPRGFGEQGVPVRQPAAQPDG